MLSMICDILAEKTVSQELIAQLVMSFLIAYVYVQISSCSKFLMFPLIDNYPHINYNLYFERDTIKSLQTITSPVLLHFRHSPLKNTLKKTIKS